MAQTGFTTYLVKGMVVGEPVYCVSFYLFIEYTVKRAKKN